MNKIYNNHKTQLRTKDYTTDAMSLEEKVRSLLETNSPIDSISPMYYTERKDGVKPETDIRTDRFEIALDACDKIHASLASARTENMKTTTEKTE